MQNRNLAVDKSSLQPLLRLVSEAESSANYNAYYGNPANTTIAFTEMPIKDVRAWQKSYVEQGSPSSAVGKYQFIDITLDSVMEELALSEEQAFDEVTQDKMAVALVERRGAEQYVNNQLSAEQFAANLAKEWASLPRIKGDKPNESYYSSDGLNASRVTSDEVLKAIERIEPVAE